MYETRTDAFPAVAPIHQIYQHQSRIHLNNALHNRAADHHARRGISYAISMIMQPLDQAAEVLEINHNIFNVAVMKRAAA